MSLPSIFRAEPRMSVLVLSVALGLAACGGGGDGNSGAAGGTSTATPLPIPVQTPAIATQPVPQSGAVGASVTFSVGATGSGLAYQWRRDGKDIAGATAASYTLNNVQPADDGAVFTVEVKNGAGSVVSAGAALQVEVPKGLSLLAGRPGGPGNLDGQDGRLWTANVVALSPSGLIYVTDSPTWFGAAGSLRTIDPATGVVGTILQYSEQEAPQDIEFDAAGNRYDMLRKAIYKTTPAGVRTLLAGAAVQPGADNNSDSPIDGIGANARFGWLAGMAIDGDGNLYVSDGSTRAIRKVDPAGKVVTLAGSIGYGVVDGTGDKASFRDPRHLTVDRAGNVFVVDVGGFSSVTKLRKVTPGGTVTTLALKAGDGTGTDIVFESYSGAIASDAAGNLYVTDSRQGNYPDMGCFIRKIAADGTITTLAGAAKGIGNADGKGTTARFCGGGISLPSMTTDKAGNLLVLDSSNNAIRRVTLSGDVTTVYGRGSGLVSLDGKGAAAAFAPAGWWVPEPFMRGYTLVADAQGNAYVSDIARVRKVTPSGDVTTLPAAAGASANARYFAGGLAWGGDAIIIQDKVVSRIDANGTLRFVAGQQGANRGPVDGTGANAAFEAPSNPIMDGLGNIYIRDGVAGPNGTVQRIERRITPDGVVTTLPTPPNGQRVAAWYADKEGKVWAAGIDGSVFTIGADGKRGVVRAAPSGSVRPEPSAITRDAAGNLYLAETNDTGYNSLAPWYDIRKIAPDGTETIVAGTKGSAGVRFGAPGSLGYVDTISPGPDGVIYLMSDQAVLKLKP